MSFEWSHLWPILVHIQAHLDEPLDLDALSARADLSPGHFQKTFKRMIGETPRSYVGRLRLERAAFRLQVQDATVLQHALDSGFTNHETFTRAFRRRFGVTPSQYRNWARRELKQRLSTLHPSTSESFALSRTSVRTLRPAHLAFIRHVGRYEDVPDTLFERLDHWAVRRRLGGPRIWIGIGHDAPGATAASKLRFDAALIVPQEFSPTTEIAYQHFAGGKFAVATHAGPYASLPNAYAAMFARMSKRERSQLLGLPAIEIYQTAQVNARLRLNVTDVCLPLREAGQRNGHH